MISVAHIINPIKADRSSDLLIAQPITFETMRIARELAQKQEDLEISFYSAQFPEDEAIVPPFFHKTPNLERSVLDLGSFTVKRKLPLLKDILDRLYQSSTAEYFIYTNVDIALMPYFYLTVSRLLREGHDGLVINRRTIPARYRFIDEIPFMYAQVGEPHLGHDCFVFRRDLYPRYKLGNVCLGIRLVGRVLVWNQVAYSAKYGEIKDLHLTFHLGSDKPWKNPHFDDYDRFNQKEALAVLQTLDREEGLVQRLKEKYPAYLTAVPYEAEGQP